MLEYRWSLSSGLVNGIMPHSCRSILTIIMNSFRLLLLASVLFSMIQWLQMDIVVRCYTFHPPLSMTHSFILVIHSLGWWSHSVILSFWWWLSGNIVDLQVDWFTIVTIVWCCWWWSIDTVSFSLIWLHSDLIVQSDSPLEIQWAIVWR